MRALDQGELVFLPPLESVSLWTGFEGARIALSRALAVGSARDQVFGKGGNEQVRVTALADLRRSKRDADQFH
jgi:hypothetical protein